MQPNGVAHQGQSGTEPHPPADNSSPDVGSSRRTLTDTHTDADRRFAHNLFSGSDDDQALDDKQKQRDGADDGLDEQRRFAAELFAPDDPDASVLAAHRRQDRRTLGSTPSANPKTAGPGTTAGPPPTTDTHPIHRYERFTKGTTRMDYLISARTHAQAVDKAAETLGVQLPAPRTANRSRERKPFPTRPARSPPRPMICTPPCSTRSKPAATIGPTRPCNGWRSTANWRHRTSTSARKRSDRLLAAALADNADDILDGWADALEPHAAALAAAAAAAPTLNLRDGHEAATHGGDVLKHWAAARTALDAFVAAERGFYALAAVAGVSYSGIGAPLALTPACRAELAPALEMAREARVDVDAWVLGRSAGCRSNSPRWASSWPAPPNSSRTAKRKRAWRKSARRRPCKPAGDRPLDPSPPASVLT